MSIAHQTLSLVRAHPPIQSVSILRIQISQLLSLNYLRVRNSRPCFYCKNITVNKLWALHTKLFLTFTSTPTNIQCRAWVGNLKQPVPITKGQFISKAPSRARGFSQKANERIRFFCLTAFCVAKRRSNTKSEFVRSFFGRKWRHHKTFWN